MCDNTCKPDEERRSFLAGSAAALTGLAVLGANAYAEAWKRTVKFLTES